MNCRGCDTDTKQIFLDLGESPVANDLLDEKELDLREPKYPLRVMVCQVCSLVQLPTIHTKEELFRDDYIYYSSYSSSWLDHCRDFAFQITSRLSLSQKDLVIEVASNDGYLLKFFANKGISVLGIEPAAEVAKVAIENSVPTHIDFFGANLAHSLGLGVTPKLIIANNVLAHVPDIHDFVEGFAVLADQQTMITFEFPHLVSLIKNRQFDTIYHEHFSYLSITSLTPIFDSHNLRIIDAEELPTHGGSLRLYVVKANSEMVPTQRVDKIIALEMQLDPRDSGVIQKLHFDVNQIRVLLSAEVLRLKKLGKRIASYGAAAKGNTLLNFVELNSTDIDYVVDMNPHKQGKYLPGSRIPVVGLEHFRKFPPDVVLILPWNLTSEIQKVISTELGPEVKVIRAIPKVEYV
jgi:SAM-dependent methyltransferase